MRESSEVRVPGRWELIRDAAVFQGKLFVDGLRDLVMGPVSLVAVLLDLLGLGRRAGLQFYDVLRLGRSTEDWIDLFRAAERPRRLPGESLSDDPGIDRLVQRMEGVVKHEYERGGITRSAKEAVDRALDRIQHGDIQQGEGRDPGGDA